VRDIRAGGTDISAEIGSCVREILAGAGNIQKLAPKLG